MAEPFLSEIRIMSFDFAPKGWALCNGQLFPSTRTRRSFRCWVRHSAAMGGSISRCRILRGRTPIHVGSGHTLGEKGGEQAHTISIAEIADAYACRSMAQSNAADTDASQQHRPVASRQQRVTAADQPGGDGSRLRLATSVASQAHLNMQPFLTLTFCIALQGIFPSPN